MADGLSGRRVAVLATDGVEQVELDEPWRALLEAGAEPTLVGLAAGSITADDHIEAGDTKSVVVALADADLGGYDALVLPDRVIDGDFVRADATEAIVEQFAAG